MTEDILSEEQVQTGDPDPREALYKGLKEKKLYTLSYDEFKNTYNTPEAANKLYKGLKERKLYTLSEDEFNKTYFPQSPGMAKPEEPAAAPVENTDQFGKKITPAAEDDIFKLAKERRSLKGQNADLRLNTIDESLKAAGYNPNEIEREFSDMPSIPGFTAKQALALKAENPALYDRKKAAIKSQVTLMDAVEKKVAEDESIYKGKEAGAKAGKEAGKAFLDLYTAQQFAKTYPDQRVATRQAVADVHQFIPDAETQHKVIAELAVDKGYGYGIGLPGTDEAIAADPRSEMWNPYQVTGMHFLEDLDPATAKSYNRLLAFSPEDIEARKGDAAFMRGLEAKSRDLENIGLNITKLSLEEKMTSMLPNKDKWNEQQKQEFGKMYERYQDLQKDMETQRERYPAMAVMDADQAMQDAMGESTRGVVEKTVLGTGENVDDAVNWLGSLFKSPFLSDQETAADDLTLLGNKRRTASDQYQTEGEALFGKRYKTVFKGDLKKAIDTIKADESLTKQEQRNKITKAILDDNNKNLSLVTNDKADKTNLTGKTILNAVSNIVSEIAPQIVLGMATGGGANASKARELISLFGSTFATAYNDNYNDAIEKNIPNPGAYAMAHTTVDAATELVGNNLEMAKKMFGGKVAGKILGELSEAEFKGMAKSASKFKRFMEAAKTTGVEGVKDAKMEGLEELLGAGGGNLVDQQLFNKDVNMTDQMAENFISTFVGMLPLGLLGLPANYRNINKNQQYAINEVGMDPQKFLSKVDQDLADQVISEPEAEKRRKIINSAATAVQEMKATKADGTPKTDNEKARELTNNLVLADIKEAQKGAPKEIKADLDLQEELIKADQADINTPPVKKLDREIIAENLKADLAAADEEYKGRSGKFKKEQRDRIREYYDAQLAEVEKQEEEEKTEEEKNKEQKTSKKETDAVQKQSTASVPVHPPSGDSKEVGKGDEGKGPIHEEAPEKEITTEEDFQKELQNVRLQPTAVQSKSIPAQPEGQPGGVQGENVTAAEGNDQGVRTSGDQNADNSNETGVQPEGLAGRTVKGSPKLTSQTALHPVAADFHKYKNPIVAIDEVIKDFKGDPVYERAANFLKPIMEANPQIQIDTDAEGKTGMKGFSHDSGKIDINFPLHENQGDLMGTILHELTHAAVRQEMSFNKAFNDELQDILGIIKDKAWGDIYGYAEAKTNFDKFNETYGTTNTSEMVAEIFSNPEFYNKVKGIQYEGKSLIDLFFEKIIALFSKSYRALAKFRNETDAKDLAEYLMQLIENTVPSDTKIKPILSEKGGLPSLQNPADQEEAIKNLIRRAKSLADSTILKNVTEATGIDPAIIQGWIDDIRKPPAPPPAGKPLAQMSPEERDLSYKKAKKMMDYEEPEKPSIFKRAWESLKNASAMIDNPYRFVTRMVEDIHKHYGTDNTAAIPLGRVFEQSAAGKASLAVEAFKNEVIDGNINGEKLGKLKGEKLSDFQLYMAMRRIIDRHTTQEKKRLAGEEVNRQTGNVTERDAMNVLEKLEQKYPRPIPKKNKSGQQVINYKEDIMAAFEKRATAFQDNMDRMLQDITAAGILSQEQYDNIKKDNDFYAPFNVVRAQTPQGKPQGAGIAGVVKRIKGIAFNFMKVAKTDPVAALNALAESVDKKEIGPDAYYDAALNVLDDALTAGTITQAEYDRHLENLASPGFAIKNMIDAAANMIYRAQGMALKNTMMQRLYAYKNQDKEGLFIQDTDYLTPMMVGNEVRMVTKPLDQIATDPDMAPVKVKLNGKDVVVAINKKAADKINGLNNTELPWIMKAANFINKGFRFFVITTSPGFQVANLLIDLARTLALSRYGPLAGKGLIEPLVNAMLYVPQYLEALGHSALSNVGYKTDSYKQWMESGSFSKGLFDQLFTDQGKVKDIGAGFAKKILNNFLSLRFIEVPGTILEQSHKVAMYQRGLSVENMAPIMSTAKAANATIDLLNSLFNQHVKPDMNQQELSDAIDRVNNEVQNYAGSPNFPQTATWLKAASIFLQFFSARVKGEMSDYRRVSSIFINHGEGIRFSKQERTQMLMQFASVAAVIGTYAMKNNADDDDEKEFATLPSYHQANYLNIPGGTFEYTDDKDVTTTHRDYIKIPLRGLTASMNVAANEFVKWKKGTNPEAFKNMSMATLANVSPLNLSGKDEREYGESVVSNLTPVFKYGLEFSFNRDTHGHRDIIPFKMIKGLRAWDADPEKDPKKKEGIAPWDVKVKNTPKWCSTLSKFMYDHLGVSVTAVTLSHMEKTMGSPTKLYDNAIGKRFKRSEMDYPVAGSQPKEE